VRVQQDGTIEGLTTEGRRFIKKLFLDHPLLTESRGQIQRIIRILGRSTDPEAVEALKRLLGFPENLPNTSALRPPRNTRPNGLQGSYFAVHERGELPAIY
jgi:hypothetical protein